MQHMKRGILKSTYYDGVLDFLFHYFDYIAGYSGFFLYITNCGNNILFSRRIFMYATTKIGTLSLNQEDIIYYTNILTRV